jgi:hypothetical protein
MWAGYLAQWSGATDGVSIGLWLASLLAGVRFLAAEAIEELVTEREVQSQKRTRSSPRTAPAGRSGR